ncbi:MAG: nucleotidyltransferase domain-containing protein [Clostridium sp.]
MVANLISIYQREFNKLTSKLKNDKNIVACFVFGSMVNGDIWQGSDIDMIVVSKEGEVGIRDVYATEGIVPIHAKFISYNEFMRAGKGFATQLKNSRMIFCNEDSVSFLYHDLRYNFNQDSEINRLIYLGNLLKDKSVCEKYLYNGGLSTSYEVLIRVINNLAKLFLNLNGYIVSKDAINMASTFNDEFKNIIHEAFNSEINDETIIKVLNYIDTFINNNIENSSKYLIEYLREEDTFLSAYEIKESINFQKHQIRIEPILNKLAELDLVKKQYKPYNSIMENVYAYKGVK